MRQVKIDAVRGTRNTREELKNHLGQWERRKRTVQRQMGGKGFNDTQVEGALNECERMILFYNKLIAALS